MLKKEGERGSKKAERKGWKKDISKGGKKKRKKIYRPKTAFLCITQSHFLRRNPMQILNEVTTLQAGTRLDLIVAICGQYQEVAKQPPHGDTWPTEIPEQC